MHIMRQHIDYFRRDCMVTDNITMASVFGNYIVVVIRKYDRNGEPIEFRGLKQFVEVNDAIDYYNSVNVGGQYQ